MYIYEPIIDPIRAIFFSDLYLSSFPKIVMFLNFGIIGVYLFPNKN
jgi:hypothetical protein